MLGGLLLCTLPWSAESSRGEGLGVALLLSRGLRNPRVRRSSHRLARLWEPRRLRFRLFSAAAQLVTTGRHRILRLTQHWPWTGEITDALERLALLATPG